MRLLTPSWRNLPWGLLGIGSASSDSPHDRPYETLAIQNRYEYSEKLDGWTRLKFVFKKNSPELKEIMDSTALAYFSGFVFGGFYDSRNAYRRFVEEHKHEMFKHPRDAQSKLRERIYYELFRGGFKYGIKLSFLTFIFTASTYSFVAYRNYLNPLDHALVGTVLGSLYTFIRGPKAAVSGGVLGGFFGLTCGLVSLGAEKISGESSKDRWLRQFKLMKDEEDRAFEMKKKAAPNKDYSSTEETEEKEFWDTNVKFIIDKLKNFFNTND